MWPASNSSRAGDDAATTAVGSSSSVRAPQQARTHVPFRSHEEPQSMGEDAYLRPSSRRSNSSGEPLAGGAASLGRASSTTSSQQRAAAAAGGVAAAGHDDDLDDDDYKPGQPIGLLAAMGTPMAKKPIWRSKKCQILCPILGLIVAAVAILLLVFPILRAVATHTLSTAVLDISTSNITIPTNSSFQLTLEGQVRKVGIFPARIYFERPVEVYWIAPEDLSREIRLGSFPLEYIGVAAGHGRIKQLTNFQIEDEAGFSRFTQFLITQEAFTWRLKSSSVQAKAFGFIAANRLDFVKDLTLPGMANMTNVSIRDFQLPGDDPQGGISLSVAAQFTNPSAFGVEIGILSVGLYYGDLYLGPAQTTTAVNLTAGVNNLQLAGRLLPYTSDPAALQQLSTLFSRYLNGEVTPVEARGATVALPSGQTLSWLTAGISALTLKVPLQSPTGRISPITGITIEQLSLMFDPNSAYAPLANSSEVSATFGLPFGFSLDIVQLENSFQIVQNRTAVASLSAPLGMSNTTILTRNAGYTTGTIELDLPQAPLMIGPSYTEHLTFDQFTYDLTTTNGSGFALAGNTSAVTNTPLGQVRLTDIQFAVPAGLIGLESLATNPTLIRSVDVIGGTPDAIVLNILVGLTNPSNLDLTVGNVTFQLFRGEDFLGTAVLPDLHLTTGYQEHETIGYFQANNNNASLSTLNDFVSGTNNDLTISGFNGSTAVESLTQAFMAIHLNATLPGLQTELLNYANLTVLPTTGRANNLADATVSLSNPFTTDLLITNIQSNVTAFGLYVGSIVQDTQFAAEGRAATDSPVLGLNLNLYPPDIFSLLRALVVEGGQDVVPLDGIVALGGYTLTPSGPNPGPRNETAAASAQRRLAKRSAGYYSGNDDLDALSSASSHFVKRQSTNGAIPGREVYAGFDLPSYVLQAFAGLEVVVDLISTVNIGQYETFLSYTQPGVPAYTDSTLTLLLPVLAQPIVQKIVDEAILGVDTVLISNPTNTAFTTGLTGSIRNAGPFDATIAFPQGLTVAWNGRPLGQIAMPDIALVGDQGATLDLTAAFNVADLGHLTDFTGYLLTEPSFTWQIYGQNLSVSALGIVVDGISIMKNVVLDGFNGLRGGVIINSFDLPSNDPAGGISLSLQTTITNPSSVGVALSTIGFRNFFGSTFIGPAAGTDVNLTPKATIQLPLTGRLVPQSDAQGLADVSTIFNGFVHGIPSDLVVRGDTAGPADVTWLNQGIKLLEIPVVLPAAVNLQVINSITINTLSLFFSQENPWAPAFSTDDTDAAFQLPFAFPLDIEQLGTTITAGSPNSGGGQRLAKRAPGDFAQLEVPMGPADTNVQARTIRLTFNNAPFQSIDNGLFSDFIARTTADQSVGLSLSGLADTMAGTAVGLLSLTDIAFDVDTSLLGLQGLNARPTTVSNLDVFRGYSDYLQINVDAQLYNPSNITIGTGDVAFGLQFLDQFIGTANIANLVLVPGDNNVPTAVRYQPSGGAPQRAGQTLLENYVQAIPSDTIIRGREDTTQIDSLRQALQTIALNTVIPPLQQKLITQANLDFPIDIAETSIASATFTLQNPFTASINLVNVLARATFQGIFLGDIDVQNLNPVINAPGKTTITSYSLPFNLVTDPKQLIRFIRAAAAVQGVDLGILNPVFDQILALDNTDTTVTSTVNMQPETCAPSGTTQLVQNTILAAVRNLRTDLAIESVVRLDEYQTPLNFLQADVPTILSDRVLYLVGLLGKIIVQSIVTEAQLSFSAGSITGVTNQGFDVALTGSLLNAGPFDASIEFPEPVDVIWEGNKIAEITLPAICSTGSAGVPNLQTTANLVITDKGRFTDFAAFILLNPGFTWTIRTENLRVLAIGTIFDNVVLQKDVSFDAFNGLPGVTIVNPDFPRDSDSPKGIALVTDASIPSPSNLGIQLGTATFDIIYEGLLVGPVSANDLTLAPRATTNARLEGTIVEQRSQENLNTLGNLFSRFLADEDQTLQVRGKEVISPAQPDSPVDWLSAAFKQLTINVVLPGERYEIISAIQLQDLTIRITEQSEAYAVPSQNNETDVTFRNPFGFSLGVDQAGGAFTIVFNGVDTALLTLPLDDVVRSEVSTGQDAALVLNWSEDRILQSLNNDAFGSFFNAATNTDRVSFGLGGTADVVAATNAGNIPIRGIPFDVQTSLLGIQSLNARPTIVSDVVVYQGFPEYLQINADAALYNPSNLTVITNEVNFGLEFQSQIIGAVLIGDLLLIPGENNIETEVRYMPQNPAQVAAGKVLLENFIQNIVSDVVIAGTPNTTPYGSLQQALGSIRIMTSIPPIDQLLITRAALTFPITIGQPGVTADAVFDLDNPFRASINLLRVVADAYYKGIYLGQINVPNVDPVIRANGGQKITSYPLPFTISTNPQFLINFLATAAADQGVSLGILQQPFEYVLSLSPAETENNITSRVNTGSETCTPTGSTETVNNIILAAVQNLRTDLNISTTARLDEYQTDLDFVQRNVPTELDESVLYLVGVVGRPIVKSIVDGAQLAFSSGFVRNVTDNGFTVDLVGSLVNVGPFDALIEFPDGVDVYWENRLIANIQLPPICSPGGQGVPNLETTGILQLKGAYQDFVDFTSFLLLNPSFTWTILTNNLRVSALKTIFENVTLQKQVTFDAFNRLSPGVTLENPDFPRDSENPPGIQLTVDGRIPSPSNLGIILGDATFNALYMNQTVGPVTAEDLTLQAKSVTDAPLEGVIIRDDDQTRLNAIGDLFTRFLMGETLTLQVQGDNVVSPAQPGRPVNWLSDAFKTLILDVELTGQIFDIIFGITLRDLDVTIESPEQAYNALVRNNATDVIFANPYGFSLTPIAAGGNFIVRYPGAGDNAAVLNVPVQPTVETATSNGQRENIVIAFPDPPAVLESLNDANYNAFFATITNQPEINFALGGGANVTARTAAGDIPIGGIPVDVTTSFQGINEFGNEVTIPEVPRVFGGGTGPAFGNQAGSDYLRVGIIVELTNPAPLNIHTDEVSLVVSYMGTPVGRAYINPLDLYQGLNTYPGELLYQPANPADPTAQALLTQYLETKDIIPITVDGDSQSSAYGSLAAALDPLNIPTGFPGQGIPLIEDIVIYLDLVQVLCNSTVSIETRLNNNLETYIQLLQFEGTASQNGQVYATFDYTFQENFRTEAGQNPGPYSEMVYPVVLVQGAIPSLALFLTVAQGLDIDITARVSVGGYIVPSLKYSQRAVPYSFQFTASGQTVEGFDLGLLPGLLNTLGDLVSCVGGILTLLPGLPSAILSLLPGIITGIIAAPVSIVSEVVGGVTSIVGDVTSVVGGVVSGVTEVVGGVTSIVGDVVDGVVGGVTSAIPPLATPVSVIDSVVDDVTGGLGTVVNGATSVVGDVVDGVGGVVTGVIGGLGLGRRDAILPTPTVKGPVATGAVQQAVPTPAPTTAPAQSVSSIEWLQQVGADTGIEPRVLQRIFQDYGVSKITPIDQWRHERDLREAEKQRLKKREREQDRKNGRVLEGTPTLSGEKRQKRWGTRN